MAIVENLMSTGIPPGAAKSIVGTISGSLTATGTNQATALQLYHDFNVFDTVALNTGCKLSAAIQICFVVNGGDEGLAVYPPTGGTINGGSTNAAVSLASGGRMLIFKINETTNDYATILSA